MVFTRSLFFLVAAAVCFAIALLGAVGVLHGVAEQAWVDGGLLSFVLAHFA